jgi:hypothetical protein
LLYLSAKTDNALARADTVSGSERAKTVHALDRSATVTGSERAKTANDLDRSAIVTGSERAKTVHALDRSATETGSERAKTAQSLDRSATMTGTLSLYSLHNLYLLAINKIFLQFRVYAVIPKYQIPDVSAESQPIWKSLYIQFY